MQVSYPTPPRRWPLARALPVRGECFATSSADVAPPRSRSTALSQSAFALGVSTAKTARLSARVAALSQQLATLGRALQRRQAEVQGLQGVLLEAKTALLEAKIDRAQQDIRAALDHKEIARLRDGLASCILCCERPRSACARPCRHLVACSPCAARLTACPMCRAPVRKWSRVILS
jgi:Zinc finger, C3HC4 type (RING finger)